MGYRYKDIPSGQIIESEGILGHLEGLARWVREEIHTAPLTPEQEAAKAAADAATEAANAAAQPAADAATVAADDAQADAAGRPRGNASRDEWAAYALAHGTSEEQIANLSRDEISALFPVSA